MLQTAGPERTGPGGPDPVVRAAAAQLIAWTPVSMGGGRACSRSARRWVVAPRADSLELLEPGACGGAQLCGPEDVVPALCVPLRACGASRASACARAREAAACPGVPGAWKGPPVMVGGPFLSAGRASPCRAEGSLFASVCGQ
ncbi:hypothetical protein [Streptomyces coelicolor A3(2)]|uniref:Uncharacterized protein n=2 Tax=Streptomyces coelicolor TaxID=1902 RepID=Q9ACU2_STRCO|nr:hypothetical protein [Streptomyces coelicolor]CAC36732.1 hypothetical protein [Streptomyces coelicolor A3(2)]